MPEAATMENANLFGLFARQAERQGARPALIAQGRDPLSYAGLGALAGRFARALKDRGVAADDRVVVQAAKSPEGVALYLACLQRGAIFVPLNTAYTDAEMRYFLEDCRPALFVHEADRAPLAPASATMAALTAEAVAAAPLSAVEARAAGDIAAICYTSGTTGRSKGAMITHANLASNAAAIIDLWRFSDRDVLLHILPIFHVHGLFVALHCALFSGAPILFETGFDVARATALLPQATVMMGVPTHYARLLADPGFGRDDCAEVRLFLCGSAPLLAETHRAFEARTGHRILERYGMTEAGMIASNPYEGARVAGTVGYPLPGVEARVRDGEGAPVAPGCIGTLEIKGPNVFSGYWEMPEKTAESFTGDGWFVTGDLVTREEDGRIAIVGREKDLIIAGGYNIYPKEIETVLDEMPGVAESAVMGVPHPDFGESVVAVIVPETGAAIDDASVRDWVEGRLARFKHPRRIHLVEALPRNAMGKVQKAELRRIYAG